MRLSIIALFRIQNKNFFFFFFFWPNRAFPSGIVSEHDNGTCLLSDVDFVTENTPEALSPVKPIMLCMCDLRRTPVVFPADAVGYLRVNSEWFFPLFYREKKLLLASSGSRPGLLLNILQCTGRPQKTKNHPTQNVKELLGEMQVTCLPPPSHNNKDINS